uniref:Putative reverse transcriptase/maturase n=1 Tax=Flintiella sanguinaria TaxID=101926 RepID=A0A1X9PUL7_9RHOD|nr:putative reverse transcriptase/maturase [Flintiella sanguinaria]
MSLLIKAWDDVQWDLVQNRVRRIQRRIFKAKKLGQTKRVHWLQKHLINSVDAKLLAVQQVSSYNKDQKTAGVERVKNIDDKQKLTLTKSLKLNGKALPIRRIWIAKPGKAEKRPLDIQTMNDRAKQALAKLALEPEWEAVFEPNSYGFRPARRAQDAIEAIFLALKYGTPKWVFDADIRKCFDRMDHNALIAKLNTFPVMEAQIRAWLKADIMEEYANTPKEDIIASTLGTLKGGVISPLLSNIALDGLEKHLKKFVSNIPSKPCASAKSGKTAKEKALTIVRYADDFVVIHENVDILNLCIEETKEWLKSLGLEIRAEKSSLRDVRQGFNFLGFQVMQVFEGSKYKPKITPSRDKQAKLLLKIKGIIQANKSSSCYRLIRILRPIVIGWANYFKYCECKDTFNKLTHLIFQKLRAWVFRRDTRNGKKYVKEKYFPTGLKYSFHGKKYREDWILNATQKDRKGKNQTIFLPHMSWVASAKYVKIKDTKSPYDEDHEYWNKRTAEFATFSYKVKTLIKRQNLCCTFCNKQFTPTDIIEVDHVIPIYFGGANHYDNLQALHLECQVRKKSQDLKSESNLQEPDEVKVSSPVLKTKVGINTAP